MYEEPRVVRVSANRQRQPRTLIVIVAILVVLAIVKPWASGSQSDGDAGRTAGFSQPSIAVPSPIASVGPFDPNQMACMSSTGERVVTLTRRPGFEVRTWQVPDGAIGTDPLDQTLVPLRITSSYVVGIGICGVRPDPSAPDASAAQLVHVIAISLGKFGPTAIDIGSLPSITRLDPGPDNALLYGPSGQAQRDRGVIDLGLPAIRILAPSTAPGASPSVEPPATGRIPTRVPWRTWVLGTYAVQFRFAADGPTEVRWLRFDVAAAAGEPG